jgi:DNA-binding XRE family transcriptional regulator
MQVRASSSRSRSLTPGAAAARTAASVAATTRPAARMLSSSVGVRIGRASSMHLRYNYPGIVIVVGYDPVVVREALSELERARGLALGAALRRARGEMPVRELAARSGLAEETIRKIERGGVPTPALFTVAAIAAVLEVPLDDLVRSATAPTAAPAVA